MKDRSQTRVRVVRKGERERSDEAETQSRTETWRARFTASDVEEQMDMVMPETSLFRKHYNSKAFPTVGKGRWLT